MSIYNTNQCEHGSLERKCEICERDNEIKELRSELEAAKGQVERMREALDKIGYLREHDGREDSSYLGRIAREALAKLKEEAIPTSEVSNSGSSTPKIRELEDFPATSKGEGK